MSTTIWSHPHYVLQQKLFSMFHTEFRIMDPQGAPILFAKMKAFKLKEDLRIFFDEAMTQEAMVMKARRILDFGATYDVMDPATNQRIGTLRRKGIKSMIRDEWAILNFDDQPIGTIEEDSWLLALIRRFLWSLMPQHYHATVNGQPVAHFHRHISFLTMKMTMNVLPSGAGQIDPRVMVAAMLLLSAIEGRQS